MKIVSHLFQKKIRSPLIYCPLDHHDSVIQDYQVHYNAWSPKSASRGGRMGGGIIYSLELLNTDFLKLKQDSLPIKIYTFFFNSSYLLFSKCIWGCIFMVHVYILFFFLSIGLKSQYLNKNEAKMVLSTYGSRYNTN